MSYNIYVLGEKLIKWLNRVEPKSITSTVDGTDIRFNASKIADEIPNQSYDIEEYQEFTYALKDISYYYLQGHKNYDDLVYNGWENKGNDIIVFFDLEFESDFEDDCIDEDLVIDDFEVF